MFTTSLLSEYHPTKNQKRLEEYKSKSNKKVWWICSTTPSHEWEAVIFNRVKGTGCPYCTGRKVTIDTSLASRYPTLATEWHPEKNDLQVTTIAPGCNKKYWWRCSRNPAHEWQASPNSRVKGSGCPHCTGRTTFGGNSLQEKYPHLLNEWDSEKNQSLDPSQICPGSDKQVWWICSEKKHSYKTKVSNRTLCQTSCPYCTHRKVGQGNSLESQFPDLAKEWHPTKNTLGPSDIVPNYGNLIHWICSKGHEWQASPTNRTRFQNQCPACSGRIASPEKNLLIKHPKIAAEWHATKNGNTKPEDFTPSSHAKVWWQCPRNPKHVYLANIANRTIGNKTDCPLCNQSKMEKAVYELLKEKEVCFEGQKKFADLRFRTNQLSYDFFLPSWNAVVECDGRQHFEEASDYFHHEKSFHTQRLRDIVKNAYAAREGFALLRIAYTEEKYIPLLLETFLNRLERGERPFSFVGAPYRQVSPLQSE